MKRVLTIGMLLMIILLITACAGQRQVQQNPEKARYYEGSDGITIKFADRDSPPDKLYYYSDSNYNVFDITAEIWNTGSSHARGGLYLSGYDPNFIHVPGINPTANGLGACGIKVGNIGFGEFTGQVFCDAARVGFGTGTGGGFNLDISQLGNALNALGVNTGWDLRKLLNDANFELDASAGNVQGAFRIPLGEGGMDLEFGSRGKLAIALFSGVDFTRTFGQEYLLAGDNPDFPGGDIAIVDWTDIEIKDFPPGLDETQQTFLITNCYLYTTHAAPIVCIDPAPFSEGVKVCNPKQFTGTKGQGAPVAVTRIEQENTPREAIFKIHVKNVGQGTVWDPGKLEKCSPYQNTRISSTDHNIVWLGQIRVSGDQTWLNCVPDDFIRLDRDTKEGIITCKYQIPYQGLKSAYQTPLVVELWYGYEDTIKKSVTIKRVT